MGCYWPNCYDCRSRSGGGSHTRLGTWYTSVCTPCTKAGSRTAGSKDGGGDSRADKTAMFVTITLVDTADNSTVNSGQWRRVGGGWVRWQLVATKMLGCKTNYI